MSSAWREHLTTYIREQAHPLEKYSHQPRLYDLTLKIGEHLTYDDDIVFAAVWIHDLGVFTCHRPNDLESLMRWDNTAYAMHQAPGLLQRFGFPMEKAEDVVEAIRTHQPKDDPTTIEGTILRDADILEQLGTIAVMRTVCKIGRDTRFHTFTDASHSLRRCLEELPQQLQLESARTLSVTRIAALESFLNCVDAEAGGHLG